jgi:hypothetical protein
VAAPVSAVMVLTLGAILGLGVVLVMAGVRGTEVVPLARLLGRAGRGADRLLVRSGAAVGLGLMAGALTGWPVVIGAGAVVGWIVPTWWDGRGAHRRELARVEALAGWTEQLRDTLAAANGLEHAIGASATVAPQAIAEPVARLAARVEYEPLPVALRRFADDVDHPLADFVVAALVVASEKEARELGTLLGHLAECARDDARMRTRIWVGRARSRTAVRIIVGVVAVFVAGLLVMDREYLSAYDTPSGQLALAVILGLFAGSFVAMERMGRLAAPERFVRRRVSGPAA